MTVVILVKVSVRSRSSHTTYLGGQVRSSILRGGRLIRGSVVPNPKFLNRFKVVLSVESPFPASLVDHLELNNLAPNVFDSGLECGDNNAGDWFEVKLANPKKHSHDEFVIGNNDGWVVVAQLLKEVVDDEAVNLSAEVNSWADACFLASEVDVDGDVTYQRD